jgi:hypothetical protein
MESRAAIDLTALGNPINKLEYPPRKQKSKKSEPESPRPSPLEYENPTIADLFEQIVNRGRHGMVSFQKINKRACRLSATVDTDVRARHLGNIRRI